MRQRSWSVLVQEVACRMTAPNTSHYWYYWSNADALSVRLLETGPLSNMKMSSYQYRKFHCGDKIVVRSSYLHSGISKAGKMLSLYWIGAQIAMKFEATYISWQNDGRFSKPPYVSHGNAPPKLLDLNLWVLILGWNINIHHNVIKCWDLPLNTTDISTWFSQYLNWCWLGDSRNPGNYNVYCV